MIRGRTPDSQVEGNHFHMVAQINKQNRADFLRDLKSTIAKSVPQLTPSYSGGGEGDFQMSLLRMKRRLRSTFSTLSCSRLKMVLLIKYLSVPATTVFTMRFGVKRESFLCLTVQRTTRRSDLAQRLIKKTFTKSLH